MNQYSTLIRSYMGIFIATSLFFFIVAVLIVSRSIFDIFIMPGDYVTLFFDATIVAFIFTTVIITAIIMKALRQLILFTVFGFLYLPMIILIVYSFNSSRLVTVWAGFSIKWYGELLQNQDLIDAVMLSLSIAVGAASLSLVLGLFASFTVVRFRRFRGANLFSFMITAPLVMPDVVTGLSLLLLFVAMGQILGWPTDRGALTILLAHVTFCTAYTTVVISARLRELDKSLEEAAMDLGANPIKVFFVITLPMITSSLLSGWLLAFTLSLDDLVISSFVTGPGATTLPMLIFSKVRLGVDPQINALATIIILIVSMVGFISWLLVRNNEKRHLKKRYRKN